MPSPQLLGKSPQNSSDNAKETVRVKIRKELYILTYSSFLIFVVVSQGFEP